MTRSQHDNAPLFNSPLITDNNIYTIVDISKHPVVEVYQRRIDVQGGSVNAKFHYAIQLANQLASWFASSIA